LIEEYRAIVGPPVRPSPWQRAKAFGKRWWGVAFGLFGILTTLYNFFNPLWSPGIELAIPPVFRVAQGERSAHFYLRPSFVNAGLRPRTDVITDMWLEVTMPSGRPVRMPWIDVVAAAEGVPTTGNAIAYEWAGDPVPVPVAAGDPQAPEAHFAANGVRWEPGRYSAVFVAKRATTDEPIRRGFGFTIGDPTMRGLPTGLAYSLRNDAYVPDDALLATPASPVGTPTR
jgi:hypothetical protein